MRIFVWLIAISLLLGMIANMATGAVQYHMIDLSNLGFIGDRAYSINDHGQIIGESGGYAFVWDQNNGVHEIKIQGVAGSYVSDINNRGQAVGSMSGSISGAFIYDDANGMRSIGTLTGYDRSTAYAINDEGQVVGWAYNSTTNQSRAFLWDEINGMQDLGTLGGSSSAFGISNAGQVVGSSNYHAFIWDKENGMCDLNPMDERVWTGHDINNSGKMITDVYGHAFTWSQSEGLMFLQDLGGFECLANSINDTGEIAGYALDTSAWTHPMFWDASGVEQVLETPEGWQGIANSINNNGDIVGFIYNESPLSYRPVVWTVVPEPSSILALVLGLGGFGGITRKRLRSI